MDEGSAGDSSEIVVVGYVYLWEGGVRCYKVLGGLWVPDRGVCVIVCTVF